MKTIPSKSVKNLVDVGWLPELNYRTDLGTPQDLDRLRFAMADGWDPQYPPVCQVANDEEVAKLMERRKAFHDQLKSSLESESLEKVRVPMSDGSFVRVDGKEFVEAELAVYEWHWLTKNGEPRKPKVLGITGNRRSSQLVAALASKLISIRKERGNDKLQPVDVADELNTEILVLVPDTPDHRTKNRSHWLEIQTFENEKKQEGFKKTTDGEKLVSVLELVRDFAYTQGKIRAMFGATAGLRLYFACRIHLYCEYMARNAESEEERQEWSKIQFVPRLLKAESEEDALILKRFDQKAFQGDTSRTPMGPMCETDARFETANKTRKKKSEAELHRPSVEEVLEWIEVNQIGSGRQDPQMKRPTIHQFSKDHSNPFVRDAMKAVDKDETAELVKSSERASVADWIYRLDEESYQLVEELVALVEDVDGGIEVLQNLKRTVEETVLVS